MNTKCEPIINYYEIYKNNVSFEQDELNLEIIKQINLEKSKNLDSGTAFELTLKDKFTKLLCEKAIMECAFLFAGAHSIKNNQDYEYFANMLLAEAKEDNRTSFTIRKNLLIENSGGLQAIHEIIDEKNIEQKQKDKEEIEVQVRVLNFYNKLESLYSS